MRHFEIQKGEWPSTSNGPIQVVSGDVAADRAAFLGADLPGLRPRFEVAKGACVRVGQVTFRDRKHPEIACVAPISGRVSTLAFGPRKTLSACIIEAEPEVEYLSKPRIPDPDTPRAALLERGFWPAFRTRPFGRMPAPDANPFAIFVNAVRAGPEAADPAVVLVGQEDSFRLGVRLLTRLTEGKVFVCQSPGGVLVQEDDRVAVASFSGSLAAGLAGTHVDRLCPVALERDVWTVGYQDVIAMGHLFQTGTYNPNRVVAIGGANTVRRRLVRTPLGAGLATLCQGEKGEILSGDAVTGRRAVFLGRFDDQITRVDVPKQRTRHRWLDRLGVRPGALIPTRALERALAVDIPPVPLLRALAVGDSEAAERLGCLALIEEDVAALTRSCTSGADYARLLRQVLDDLMDGAA